MTDSSEADLCTALPLLQGQTVQQPQELVWCLDQQWALVLAPCRHPSGQALYREASCKDQKREPPSPASCISRDCSPIGIGAPPFSLRHLVNL